MGKKEGFVLVSVVWLLLVGVMIASYLASWIVDALDEDFSSSEQRQFMIDAHSTRSVLLYLLTTQRMTVSGLTTDFNPEDRTQFDDESNWSIGPSGAEIRLDNRHYSGIGNVVFALQDLRGLININFGGDAILDRFLANEEVETSQRQNVIAKLRDYIDIDELYRLNGAEKSQYLDAGLPPPVNAPLRSTLELRQVLGWSESVLPITNDVLLRNFTTVRDAQMNLNSAPIEVLRSLPFISVSSSQKILAFREFSGIKSRSELATLLGDVTTDDLDPYVLFPSRYIGLTLWNSRLATSKAYLAVRLASHVSGDKPWAVLESFTYSLSQGLDVPEDQQPASLPASAKAIFY